SCAKSCSVTPFIGSTFAGKLSALNRINLGTERWLRPLSELSAERVAQTWGAKPSHYAAPVDLSLQNDAGVNSARSGDRDRPCGAQTLRTTAYPSAGVPHDIRSGE